MSTKKLIVNIVIIVVVLAAVVGALLWVNSYQPDSDEPVQDESISLFSTERDSIAKIAVTNPDESYTLVKEEDRWVVEGQPDLTLSESRVDTLLTNCTSLDADQKVEESPDDLAVYGLSAPTRKTTITLTDGTSMTVSFGNGVAANTVRYFMVEGDPAVYAGSYYKGDNMTPTLASLRDLQIYSMNADSLRHITLRVAGQPDITFEAMTGADEQGNEIITGWNMTSPYQREGDYETINTEITGTMSELTADAVASDDTSNLAAFGLDAPRGSLSLTDKDGAHVTLLIGAEGKQEDDTFVYVMLDGGDKVYQVGDDTDDFLSLAVTDLMTKFIKLQNIEEVNSVTVTGRGTQYEMTISGEGDNQTYAINGKSVEESPFKAAYQDIIGIMLNGICTVQPTGEPEYTVVYHKKDGTDVTIAFTSVADRSYAATLDGVTEFTVLKKDVTAMFDLLERTAAE